jgi:hypothetical protein
LLLGVRSHHKFLAVPKVRLSSSSSIIIIIIIIYLFIYFFGSREMTETYILEISGRQNL